MPTHETGRKNRNPTFPEKVDERANIIEDPPNRFEEDCITECKT